MFGRRILGGHPDGFRMSLGWEVAGPAETPTPAKSPLAQVKATSILSLSNCPQ